MLLQKEAIDFTMWCKNNGEFVYQYECNRHYNEILYAKFKSNMKKEHNEVFRVPAVSEPSSFETGKPYCKCCKEYVVYNEREGINICTLCGKITNNIRW